MISQISIETIKNQMDIVDIVSDYIELKKQGSNFVACCPFHSEKTPSFVVSPSKQIFHCFGGCSVGGDAIEFIMKHDKLNYPEALEKIANSLNINIEYEAGGNGQQYTQLIAQVNVFYIQNLNDEHRKYLYNRGINEESIRKWEIGFAPRNPNTKSFLEQNFLSMEMSQELGILAKSENRIYARFAERIIFPIKSHTGHIVGFSGRTIKSGTKSAKYINSIDSKLFDKSRLLFGMDKAKEFIYSSKIAIIHEGPIDIILTHQNNIKNTVATQGTALTEKHLPFLKKTGAYIILAYDGDNAGKVAALKASILLSSHGFDGGVVLFEENKDPADMMSGGKIKEYKEIISNPTSIINFVLIEISRKYSVLTSTNPHDKNNALKECVEYLKTLNPIIANEYVNYLSDLLSIDRRHIEIGETKKVNNNILVDKNKIEGSLLLTLYLNPKFTEWCLFTIDSRAWRDYTLLSQITTRNASESSMSSLSLREDVFELEWKQFVSVCKQKQKKFLLSIRENCTDFSEIIKINKKIKEVS